MFHSLGPGMRMGMGIGMEMGMETQVWMEMRMGMGTEMEQIAIAAEALSQLSAPRFTAQLSGSLPSVSGPCQYS